MITVDLGNSFSDKVGLLNGLNRRRFEKDLDAKTDLITQLFQSKNKIGSDFLYLPDDQTAIKNAERFKKTNRHWQHIVVLGIGGSALGAIAVQEAILGPFNQMGHKPNVFVLDNIDPDYVDAIMSKINLSKTLFIVISKSGSTVEPMALYSLATDLLKKKRLNPAKHMVFITDPHKGLLRPIGEELGIPLLAVPEWVGGRFSVLSNVGLLPLVLAGVNIKKLMKGAATMRDHIKKTKGSKNPALQLALAQYELDRNKKKVMTVMMPYHNALFRIGDWYRQLLAESIGKNKKSGPTPVNALGSTDQHSQLQLYNEGPNNKWIVFIRTEKTNTDYKLGKHLPDGIEYLNQQKMSHVLDAAYAGTKGALTKNKRPNATITLPKIDEESVGALLMLLECQVALMGALYKVNAFNQPGVEASKLITKKILSTNS